MGLFGNKKREAELQNEVTKLREEVEELRELKDAVPDDFKSAIELSKKKQRRLCLIVIGGLSKHSEIAKLKRADFKR